MSSDCKLRKLQKPADQQQTPSRGEKYWPREGRRKSARLSSLELGFQEIRGSRWLRVILQIEPGANHPTINSGMKSSMFGGVALFALIFYASGIPTLQKDILMVFIFR